MALRLDEAYGNAAHLGDLVAASDDAEEGARAWAENRQPEWRGR